MNINQKNQFFLLFMNTGLSILMQFAMKLQII